MIDPLKIFVIHDIWWSTHENCCFRDRRRISDEKLQRIVRQVVPQVIASALRGIWSKNLLKWWSFLWISMDFSGFLWIFLDFCRFLMDFYGFFLISMDPYGFPISTNVKWRGFQTYERWKWLENWEMEFDTWNSHEGKGNSMLFNECDANNCTPFSVWQTPKLPTFFPTLRSYIEVS